jgi:hypothetical protein
MFRFLSNLSKVISKKKKEKEQESFIPFVVPDVCKGRNIKWIKKGLGIEKTSKGCIVHAIDCDLCPEEVIEIVKNIMKEES